jgi:hypothetical protein
MWLSNFYFSVIGRWFRGKNIHVQSSNEFKVPRNLANVLLFVAAIVWMVLVSNNIYTPHWDRKISNAWEEGSRVDCYYGDYTLLCDYPTKLHQSLTPISHAMSSLGGNCSIRSMQWSAPSIWLWSSQ